MSGPIEAAFLTIRAIVRYATRYKAIFNALKGQQTAVLMCRAQSCKTIVLKLFLLSVGFIHKNNWMQPESYFFQFTFTRKSMSKACDISPYLF